MAGVSPHLPRTTWIGGTAPADRNIISGNNFTQPYPGSAGVYLASGGNVVQGDYIGTDRNGTSALGNDAGVTDYGSPSTNNTIGGTTAGAGNVISGNAGNGIFLGGSEDLVAGNLIGTTANGLVALGNGQGIEVWGSDNTIGGTSAGARNIISGNSNPSLGNGIDIEAVGPGGAEYNVVEGNYIGTDITGTVSLRRRRRRQRYRYLPEVLIIRSEGAIAVSAKYHQRQRRVWGHYDSGIDCYPCVWERRPGQLRWHRCYWVTSGANVVALTTFSYAGITVDA